jgi:hypothetical protein
MTGATSGRVLRLDADFNPIDDGAGGLVSWPLTVSGTPTENEAVLVHAFTTGDLTSADVNHDVPLRALCTVSGVEYLDDAIHFELPVLP